MFRDVMVSMRLFLCLLPNASLALLLPLSAIGLHKDGPPSHACGSRSPRLSPNQGGPKGTPSGAAAAGLRKPVYAGNPERRKFAEIIEKRGETRVLSFAARLWTRLLWHGSALR
jgi:hypothetical protein